MYPCLSLLPGLIKENIIGSKFKGSEVQRFRVQGSGFRGSGFKVQGYRFRVQGSRFNGSMVQSSKVQGFGLRSTGSWDYDPTDRAAIPQAAFEGSGLLCLNIVEYNYFAQINTFRNKHV